MHPGRFGQSTRAPVVVCASVVTMGASSGSITLMIPFPSSLLPDNKNSPCGCTCSSLPCRTSRDDIARGSFSQTRAKHCADPSTPTLAAHAPLGGCFLQGIHSPQSTLTAHPLHLQRSSAFASSRLLFWPFPSLAWSSAPETEPEGAAPAAPPELWSPKAQALAVTVPPPVAAEAGASGRPACESTRDPVRQSEGESGRANEPRELCTCDARLRGRRGGGEDELADDFVWP